MPSRTEEMASSAMGKVKGAKAALEGLSGVFRHLAQEHGEVSALLMRVKMSSDVELRRNLFPDIRKQLLSHERGELREVYPVLNKYPQTKEIVERHGQEATQLEHQIEKLQKMNVEDAQWAQSFERLVDLVQHHVREEEDEFFPAAQRTIGEDETKKLLKRYEEAKSEEMSKLS
ncbi:MAG TPA: hemerythrin domain-containing protein [Polyangiaceae bacterium]|nr:hemerythrin domain-containing protein [Polyangiaceae bacterium]